MENLETTAVPQNSPLVSYTPNFDLPASQERTRGKILIYITAVIGILLLVGGALLYFSNYMANFSTTDNETDIAPTPTVEITPTPTELPTPDEENELDADSLIMEIEGSTDSLNDNTDSMSESLDKLDFDSADSELQNTVF